MNNILIKEAKKMKIGIDIDGVLTDISRAILDYGAKFCYDNGLEFIAHPEEYNERKALTLSDECIEKFWNQYLEIYATKYPTREFAREVIQKLKEYGHSICIITARNEEGLPPETYGTMQLMVKEWLQDNEIIYDELVFSKESKVPYCMEHKLDIMIEDSPRNVLEISQKMPVLCFDNPYNKQVEGKNITRVYSWYDILYKIEKMQSKET